MSYPTIEYVLYIFCMYTFIIIMYIPNRYFSSTINVYGHGRVSDYVHHMTGKIILVMSFKNAISSKTAYSVIILGNECRKKHTIIIYCSALVSPSLWYFYIGILYTLYINAHLYHYIRHNSPFNITC